MRCATSSRTRGGFPGPVLLHVRTVKGKGFEPAESDSRTFHGVGPNVYSPDEGRLEKKSGRPTFAQAFADALIAVAARDERVIGITAAMPDGTGLAKFAKAFPTRYFDVGIAEAHAVCFAAGASTSNIKPVCAIYSTFLQRAYDQIVHDVAVQNLPVVFALDRAGLRRRRRPDAHGPLRYRLPAHAAQHDADGAAQRGRDRARCSTSRWPSTGRPRCATRAGARADAGTNRWHRSSSAAPRCCAADANVAILALGVTVDAALDAYELMTDEAQPTVVNMRFVKPLDENLILELAETHTRFITLEEHSLAGGFGSAVVEFLNDRGLALPVERIGVPNVLVHHAKPEAQRAQFGLTGEHVAARVSALRDKVRPAAGA